MKKTAYKDIFYHGTSTSFLPSILKSGLSPSPKSKVWSEGYKRRPGDIGLESYPGVYLTNNLLHAYAASRNAMEKFGGNRMIVIVTAETRSPEVRIDEDNVQEPGSGIAIQDKVVSDWYRNMRLLDYWTFDASDEDLIGASRAWIERVLKIKPTDELMRAGGIVLRAWLEMRIALELENEQGAWSGAKAKLKERFGENIPDKYTKPVDAIIKYRNYMDRFLAKAKELVEKHKDDFLNNIRLDRGIAYKGANKILVVVELDNDKWADTGQTKIIIRYFSDDGGREALNKMLGEYRSGIGNEFELIM